MWLKVILKPIENMFTYEQISGPYYLKNAAKRGRQHARIILFDQIFFCNKGVLVSVSVLVGVVSISVLVSVSVLVSLSVSVIGSIVLL